MLPLLLLATLTPHQPLTLPLSPDARHTHAIALPAAHLAILSVDAPGAVYQFQLRSPTVHLQRESTGQWAPLSTCWLTTSEPAELTVLSHETTPGRHATLTLTLLPPAATHDARARGCLLRDQPATTQRLAALEAAVKAFAAAADTIQEAETQTLLGVALWDANRIPEALTAHENAVRLWSTTPHHARRITAQCRLAVGLLLRNQTARAHQLLRSAIDLANTHHLPVAAAEAANELAQSIGMQGARDEARSLLEPAIAATRAAAHRQGEADASNTLGILLQNAGQLDAAQQLYQRSLALRRQLNAPIAIAQSLNNLATVSQQSGDPAEAIAFLEQALALRRQHAGPQAVANTEHNLASALILTGQFDKASPLLDSALAVWRQTNHLLGQASTLAEMATLALRTGHFPRAASLFAEAQPFYLRLGNKRGHANALIGQANAVRRLHDHPTANRLFQTAIELTANTYPQEHIRALHGLGALHLSAQRPAQALPFLQKAAAIASSTYPGELASVRYSLAEALLATRQPAAAITAANESLAVATRMEMIPEQRNAHALLARAYLAQQQLPAALAAANRAIGLANQLRGAVSGFDNRARYLAGIRDTYRTAIDIHIRAGDLPRAFDISQQARARALLDLLDAADARVPPPLARQETNLRLQIQAKAEQLTRLLTTESAPPRAPQLRAAIASLSDQHAQLLARITRDHAPAHQSTPLPLSELQRRLAPTQALIEFFLAEPESYAWIVTRSHLRLVTLPPRSLVRPLTLRLASALHAPTAHAAAELTAFHHAITARLALPPLTHLYLVPDAELQLVPFAALPAFTNLPLSVLPAASLLARLPALPRTLDTAAVFADAVYEPSDTRLPSPTATSGDLRLPRLRFSHREAALFTPPASAIATGFGATRAAMLAAPLSRHPILHLATHTLLDENNPALSSLVFSRFDPAGKPIDGLLRLPDILRLPLNGQLAVLSACQTAIGPDIAGEGFLSLQRAFLAAGAGAVISSLWQVDDAATSELMRAFYSALRAGATPAAALHRAQITIRSQPRFHHPYYWAGFLFSGR